MLKDMLLDCCRFDFDRRGGIVDCQPHEKTTCALGQGQALLHTVPFKAGDEGARIYRMPAIWWMPKKPLTAFAERRMEQRRMFGDVDIVLRRSCDHGQT